MKNQSLRWRFINQTNTTETVLVHDQASAQTLAMLLQKMGGEWMMQEERSLSAMAPTAAPTMSPTTAPMMTPAMTPAFQPQAPVTQHVAPPAPALQISAPVSAPVSAPMNDVTRELEPQAMQHQAIEEESAEDQTNLGHAMLEAVVNAAKEAHAEQERKAVVPPPAPKKPEKRERRAQQRFMTEFRVILISGSSSFRTMSADVSLGGMRLKKTIPASFMKEKCIAYVSHKDLRENIEIVCHVIGDPADPCRIQFLQPNQTQLKRLNDWLVEHNGSKKAAS